LEYQFLSRGIFIVEFYLKTFVCRDLDKKHHEVSCLRE
jgi:hypothetical protein